jgi:hypothetical protein
MLYKISVAVRVGGEEPSEKGLYCRFDPILIAPLPNSNNTYQKRYHLMDWNSLMNCQRTRSQREDKEDKRRDLKIVKEFPCTSQVST